MKAEEGAETAQTALPDNDGPGLTAGADGQKDEEEAADALRQQEQSHLQNVQWDQSYYG